MLEPYSFTEEKKKWLEGMLEEKVQELIMQQVCPSALPVLRSTWFQDLDEILSTQYDDLLRVTSLKDAAEALSKPYNVRSPLSLPPRPSNSMTTPIQEPLSHHPSLEPTTLSHSLHTFSTWLSTPSVTHSPRLAHLQSPISPSAHTTLHDRIHHAALRRLGRLYARLCGEVRRAENRYEAGAVLLGQERPFGQMGLLWQILGVEEEGEVGREVEQVAPGETEKTSGSVV